MIADCRFRIADRFKRGTLCIAAGAVAVAVGLFSGCITKPQNPAATQPATALDPATTQPSYWLNQPPAAQVQGRDFDRVLEACKQTARGYLFALDRVDYRAGEVTTLPIISKQWFEPWRPDTGTAYQVFANSLGAIRRTLSFDVARNPDGETYTVTPKVLVEREAILERRVTDVSQYRLAFSGPGTKIPAREAVNLDPSTYPDVPVKYWYPIGRDAEMERQVAERLRRTLAKNQGMAGARGGAGAAVVESKAAATPLQADGVVSDLRPDGTLLINLGTGEKVVPGMTFEVYDGRATLPTLATYGEHNPGSKGWIEIVSVGNGSSTCKVVKPEGGVPPRAGDQIFNFIFARGRENHFGIAGDLANRETLTALITRWNGVVDAAVGQRSDYLILGSAPRDEAGRRAYDAARGQAEQLKVPIVSEDRFNLLIRYYDPR